MRKILIIFSVMIFIIANVGLSQDIINETGKDGKFIVRDAEQQEALVIEDGNVGITGELSVEQMPEGSSNSPNVVWDPEDKKFKIVERIFSELSPLSEPLETKSWHSISYDQVDDDGNIINTSVQGTAAAWNVFTTDYGQIHLGPADSYYCHIYTGQTRFLFNKPLTFVDAKFGSQNNQNFQIQTGGINRITVEGTTGDVGIGITNPAAPLAVDGNALFQNSSTGYSNVDGLYVGDDGSHSWLFSYDNDVQIGVDGNSGFEITIDYTTGHIGFGDTSPDNDFHINGGDANTYVNIQNTTTGSDFQDGLEFTVSGNTAYIRNQEDADLILGTNNSNDLTIEDGGQIGIQTTSPGAGLDVNTDIILGVSGTRFMEIREISGTTGTSTYTNYTDKLPSGWTGDKTRVLSLEIQYNGSTGNWYSIGYTIGDYEIACRLYHSSRTFAVWNPSGSVWEGQAWRAMIMRMP